MGNLNTNTYTYYDSFIFTDTDLIELFNFLNLSYDIQSVLIKKENDSEEEITDFNEITNIKNFGNHKVKSISVFARLRKIEINDKKDGYLKLDINNSIYDFNSTFNLTFNFYDKNSGLSINDYIIKLVERRKRNKYYSFLYKYFEKIYFTLSLMTILSLLFLALNLENIKLSKYNYSFVYFSMSYLVFSIIYLFRPYLIKNLFPTVAFLIGDEKNDEIKRDNLRSNILWLCLGGIILPLIFLLFK